MVTVSPLTTVHSQNQPVGIPDSQTFKNHGAGGAAQGIFERKRLATMNLARQKEMVSQGARLLALAKEVKTSFEMSQGTPSTAELRKVEQIEKLAHSVNEKMRSPLGN
jgi:hypothetical protein